MRKFNNMTELHEMYLYIHQMNRSQVSIDCFRVVVIAQIHTELEDTKKVGPSDNGIWKSIGYIN